MTFEEQAALVCCVKGAGSSILWMLLLCDDSLTAVQLQEATGYSDKPVSQALARLKALGLVAHQGRAQGWRVNRRNWGKVARWQGASGRLQTSGHNDSTGAESEPFVAEREEDSAVMAVESSTSCVSTEHKLSTETEGEDAGGLSAGGAAVENAASTVENAAVGEDSAVRGGAACVRAAEVTSASAEVTSASAVENAASTVENAASTVISSAVTVKSSAVREAFSASGCALSGPDFAAAKRKSGVDRNISAFPARKRRLSPEKIRILKSSSCAKRSRGVAERQARARARNRSTTYCYCFYDVRSSKQVKRQAKTRAGAREPPRGLEIWDLAALLLRIWDVEFWISDVGNGRGELPVGIGC